MSIDCIANPIGLSILLLVAGPPGTRQLTSQPLVCWQVGCHTNNLQLPRYLTLQIIFAEITELSYLSQSARSMRTTFQVDRQRAIKSRGQSGWQYNRLTCEDYFNNQTHVSVMLAEKGR